MISILTSTYNRSYILSQLYESLKNQSIKDFEWIIVDDGSTDNTKDIVNKWIKETNAFKITYLKQKNGGKHSAINKGVPLAMFDYIYIIDSDDYMTFDAVEKIHLWLATIIDKEEFAGVSGLKGVKSDSGINVLGQFPTDMEYIEATNLERKQKKLLGDKAEVYRKDLLLKFPFPEFEGETFIGEATVWNKIAAEGFKIRWFNQIICICKYLDDGLTKSDPLKRSINNFKGYTYLEKMNIKLGSFPYSKLAIGRYYFLARKKGLSIKQIQQNLGVSWLDLYLGIFFESLKGVVKLVHVRN
jgi:glycosyltransferase involved in cell wall biosynthesis